MLQAFSSNEASKHVVEFGVYSGNFTIERRVIRDFAAVYFDVKTLVTDMTVLFVDFAVDVLGKPGPRRRFQSPGNPSGSRSSSSSKSNDRTVPYGSAARAESATLVSGDADTTIVARKTRFTFLIETPVLED